MKQLITFQGRSLLFNLLFVLLNLIGLTFVVIGFHDNFESNGLIFKIIGFLLMSTTIAGLLIFRGRLMMSSFSRVIVGGICIVSGLVKANDPLGFSYKLEEYFEDGALAYRIKEMFGMPGFSLEFLIDYALVLSVVICVVEIILGVLLIIGGEIKKTAYFTLLMMLFFTFLTWHTANCDPDKKFIDRDTYSMSDPVAMFKIEESKTNNDVVIHSKSSDFLVVDEKKQPQCVDDCGCFGDAMKGSVGRSLTPKESLWKDIILVYLTLWIFLSQWIILPNNRKQNLYFVVSSLVIISFFSWVFGWSFPIFFGIVVLLAALWIIRAGGKFFGNYSGAILIVTIISMFFITYVLMYEPLKDYRPYAIGSNLKAKMNDGREGVYESLLVYKNIKTGEVKEFSSTSETFKNFDWTNKNWVYQTMVQKVIVETRLPSIADFEPAIEITDIGKDELQLNFIQNQLKELEVSFVILKSIETDQTEEVKLSDFNLDDYPTELYQIKDTIQKQDIDITDIKLKDFILNEDAICVVFSRSLEDGDWNNLKQLKSLQKASKKLNVPFVLICNASRKEVDAFKKRNHLNLPVFVNDEITIKAISRSNPSLLVIKKSVVVGKYPHRSLPKIEKFNKIILE
jgi:hypothetical protein